MGTEQRGEKNHGRWKADEAAGEVGNHNQRCTLSSRHQTEHKCIAL